MPTQAGSLCQKGDGTPCGDSLLVCDLSRLAPRAGPAGHGLVLFHLRLSGAVTSSRHWPLHWHLGHLGGSGPVLVSRAVLTCRHVLGLDLGAAGTQQP